MGMFDEVHTGIRCGQTKALGKRGARYAPGDTVRCIPAPLNDQEFQLYLRGGIAPVADTFQVAMHEGGYLTVRDAVLVGWDTQRDASLPLYDNVGCAIGDGELDDSYLYFDDDRKADVTARRAGTETAREELFTRISGQRPLAELDPVRDAAEIAQRLQDMRIAADFDELQWTGRPGACEMCAAVRDGRLEQHRAARRPPRRVRTPA